MRTLQVIARQRGERISRSRPSKLNDEFGDGYAVVRHKGGAPVTDGVTRDGCDFSLTDLARRYEPHAYTEKQHSIIKAIVTGEV
jgi:hypothetical protein